MKNTRRRRKKRSVCFYVGHHSVNHDRILKYPLTAQHRLASMVLDHLLSFAATAGHSPRGKTGAHQSCMEVKTMDDIEWSRTQLDHQGKYEMFAFLWSMKKMTDMA